MKELENIFKESYNYIEEMLIEEYGYRYEELIRNRLSKTNYIFKSTPDITYYSLKELGYDPKKYKSLEKYYQDYINYRQVEDYLDKKIKKKIYNYLKEKLSLSDDYLSKHLNEILSLNYQVFSENSMNILRYSLNESLKSLIIEKQSDFIRRCMEEDLPLAVIDISKELDAYTSLLERSKQIQLLKLTNFGKEMTNHISNILDTNHYYESLNYSRKILFDDNNAATTWSIERNKKSYIIVYLPILKIKDDISIDHVLVHESIHAIESKKGNSGIGSYKRDNNVINELKTESKTMRLHNKMAKNGISIFDTEENSNKTECLYTHFVPLIDYLLQDYEDLFNYCSLYNKVSPLYKVFGKDNFVNFSKDVSDLYYTADLINKLVEKGTTVSINITPYKNQIDEMKAYSKRKIIK